MRAFSLLNVWHGLPVAVRAVIAALLVLLAGSLPWSALAAANARLNPSFPWAALVMACYLWLYWRTHQPPKNVQQLHPASQRVGEKMAAPASPFVIGDLRRWARKLIAAASSDQPQTLSGGSMGSALQRASHAKVPAMVAEGG